MRSHTTRRKRRKRRRAPRAATQTAHRQLQGSTGSCPRNALELSAQIAATSLTLCSLRDTVACEHRFEGPRECAPSRRRLSGCASFRRSRLQYWRATWRATFPLFARLHVSLREGKEGARLLFPLHPPPQLPSTPLRPPSLCECVIFLVTSWCVPLTAVNEFLVWPLFQEGTATFRSALTQHTTKNFPVGAQGKGVSAPHRRTTVDCLLVCSFNC